MPRHCTVCDHPQRAAIDTELAGGTALRTIADRFALSKTALIRHKAEHLPASLVASEAAADEARALDVLQQLRAANTLAWQIARQARDSGEPDRVLRALDRILRQISLQAELLEQIDRRPVVNILANPEWVALRTALIEVLRPYPEVRVVVAERLLALEAGHAAG